MRKDIQIPSVNVKGFKDMRRDIQVPFKVKGVEEEGVFKGNASLFDNKPDSYNDIIKKGAFLKTIKKGGRNRTGILMLYNHNASNVPPGVWTNLSENSQGLSVEGKFALKTSLGHDLYEIVKLSKETGAFSPGLSIGYDIVDFESNNKTKIRVIKEVELWEISIVNFPAKIGANVTTVKAIESASTEREFEKALRDAGLSKNAAQYVTKLCKGSLREAEVKEKTIRADGLKSIFNVLREVNESFPSEAKPYSNEHA
jgi:HK97 family phage prohead protease